MKWRQVTSVLYDRRMPTRLKMKVDKTIVKFWITLHILPVGFTINSGMSIEHELQTRTGRTVTTFNPLRERAWNGKCLTIRRKCRIYECCILSTLLYGAETWTTYVRHEKKLNAFHIRCLWRTMGINWWDEITNEEVLTRTGTRSLFLTLKVRRMQWLGHMQRIPDGRLPGAFRLLQILTDPTTTRFSSNMPLN